MATNQIKTYGTNYSQEALYGLNSRDTYICANSSITRGVTGIPNTLDECFDRFTGIKDIATYLGFLSGVSGSSGASGGSVVKKTNTTAKTITEGLASKPVASTAPKKDLASDMALKTKKR